MGDSERARSDEVIDIEAAAALLEVTRDRVQVMIEGGLLNPLSGPGEPRFYRGEVIAARELGG
jgi:hypothetical protein